MQENGFYTLLLNQHIAVHDCGGTEKNAGFAKNHWIVAETDTDHEQDSGGEGEQKEEEEGRHSWLI